jgi:hypothetical protein
MKVVAEKTLDGGETLKITIMASNTRDRRRQAAKCSALFYTPWMDRRVGADGPGHRQTVRMGLADGPTIHRSSDDHVPSSHDDQK